MLARMGGASVFGETVGLIHKWPRKFMPRVLDVTCMNARVGAGMEIPQMRLTLLIVLFAEIMLQAGCVTGRRTLTLPPTELNTPASPLQGLAYIASVTDERQFQNKPPDPSTPSVDGDVAQLSPQQKDRVIGRQRNGYGHAMGDIALADGDSVTQRARLLIEQALSQQGYKVVSDASAPNSVKVSIDRFWGWMTPGFVALTFEAQIQCRVTVTNRSGVKTATIRGYALNHGQVAKNENWLEAFDPAFKDFIINFGNTVSGLGLLSDVTISPGSR